MTRDKVFQNKTEKKTFKFDKEVAEVFDDMANRSIINYQEVLKLTTEATCYFAKKETNIYDLGCSTGNTLLAIAQAITTDCQLIGYDLSEAMLKKCQQKLNSFSYGEKITIRENDCLNAPLDNASVIIMNYTLQFIPSEKRLQFIKKIYNKLQTNGILILSEKVYEDNEIFNKFNTEKYYQTKQKNGYSQLEIANKRNALEKILIPNTYQDNYTVLQQAGFFKIMTLFKCLNFATYLAQK